MDLFLPVISLLLYLLIGVFIVRLLYMDDNPRFTEMIPPVVFWPIVVASGLVVGLIVAIDVGLDNLFEKKG